MKAAMMGSLLAVLCMQAWAQSGPGTVKVGKETKITRGTVVKLTNGDISCYVELKDDAGKLVSESADFDVCDEARYKGKRVELNWTLAKVQAASCQGDPNCTKSETVPLIKSMKVIGPGAAPAKGKVAEAPPMQESYCAPVEKVIFACPMGKKLVSVCADPKSTPKAGMLQYRFGNPAEPVMELMWPESYLPPAKVASGTNFPLAGGGGAWMRIPKGDHAYVVYTAIGKFGPGGATATKAGLTVERKGKPIAQLKCTGKVISELGPDWFDKVGITDQNQDFDLPD